MKWKSHVAIAKAISNYMGLSPDLEKALCSGSVEPDKRPDAAYKVDRRGRTFIGRAPHHQPPTGTIMAYVWRSRKAYLLGNDYWAVKSLGRALHYVQDKSLSVGFLGMSHDSREEKVSHLQPPPEAVARGFELAVCSPHFIRECINAVHPRKDPQEVMYQATMFSAAIFASVLGPQESPQEFLDEYGRTRKRHWLLRLPVAGGSVGVAALASYHYRDPLLIIPGLIIGYVVVRSDRNYYHLADEAEWFGAV